MKKVMFITYGGVHANLAGFVCKHLQETGEYETVVLGLTVAPQVLRKHGLKCRTIKEYLPIFPDRQSIEEYGALLAQGEYNPNSGIDYEDSIAYLGFGFRDLIVGEGSVEKARTLFEQLGRKAFCPIETMKVILGQEGPDVLVLSSNVRYEKAAGLAANTQGIPVVHVHDLPQMQPLAYDATICVMNDYAKKYAIDHGVCSEEKIRVTGQPVLEDNTSVLPENLAAFKEAYHIDDYKKVVTFLEQPNHPTNASIEALLQKEAQEHPDILYIGKLHPNQELDSDRVCDRKNYIKSRDCSLKELLAVSCVAITYLSNSGMEAALMGVPLIVVEIDQPLTLDFSKYGIAAKATSIDQLKDMIYAMLDGTLMVKNKDFNNEPNAAKNIVDVIKSVI